jgi:hypothetical protein
MCAADTEIRSIVHADCATVRNVYVRRTSVRPLSLSLSLSLFLSLLAYAFIFVWSLCEIMGKGRACKKKNRRKAERRGTRGLRR